MQVSKNIYFVINFEFTQVSFYLSKLRFLENFPITINCRIVTIFISFQRKYNFQESDVFLCRSMYHLIEREKKAWLDTRFFNVKSIDLRPSFSRSCASIKFLPRIHIRREELVRRTSVFRFISAYRIEKPTKQPAARMHSTAYI